MPLAKPTALLESMDRNTFSCGDDPLDAWLRHHALDHQHDRTTNTFVIIDRPLAGRGDSDTPGGERPSDPDLTAAGSVLDGPRAQRPGADGAGTEGAGHPPPGGEVPGDAGGRIAGYYCLATAAVERVPGSRRRSRRPTEPVPAMFVGRLAVDLRYAGRGVGARLVRDAVMRSLTVHRMVGLPVLLAHTPHAAGAAFYHHLGFRPTRFDPYLHALALRAAAG
ncbi:GNAT family N-acetyltransferase [Frankia sp. AgPm24]|uniref:GNAT family N-acetyltransferase n=1 Tax=Frankia sp. AgPm24 TaxID=631128 RepID=UPI0027E28B27|nr:GNAT family N-acetyltransferase [Frankia sp. AgPm24]